MNKEDLSVLVDFMEEVLKEASPGPYYWSDDYPDREGAKTLSLIAEGDGGYGVLSCDGMANSPNSRNAEFIRAFLTHAPTLIQLAKNSMRYKTALEKIANYRGVTAGGTQPTHSQTSLAREALKDGE